MGILPEPGERQSTSGPSVGRDGSDQRDHNAPAQDPVEQLQRRHASVVESVERHAAAAAEKASGEAPEGEARCEDDAGRSEIVPGPEHGVEAGGLDRDQVEDRHQAEGGEVEETHRRQLDREGGHQSVE